MRGDYKTSIRMRAASERLNSICLNTELKNNIKIISKDISIHQFIWKIKGPKKNVIAAKKHLEEQFNVSL